ncbi:MAG: hypothetical protein [Olavius algarvensis Gamma 1 endosymbiont]|nr:MAG: hypothetical protein [Olavius algarvensis Gamma 1 endosymbiont]
MYRTDKLFPLLLLAFASAAYPVEWSGNLAVEARIFPFDAQWPGQENGGPSLSLQPEFRHRWRDGKRGLTIIPFLRIDSTDEERTHADIRELNYLHVTDGWEIRAGIDKVFWGVTESQHLVDIVNQTDLVENIDGEDKLGQPMVRVTKVLENGALDLFLLPWFRERTFPGSEGRLRAPLVVDTDQAHYESDQEERHPDYALRWNQTRGAVDLALSWFAGTARNPQLRPGAKHGKPVLIPHYPLLRRRAWNSNTPARPGYGSSKRYTVKPNGRTIWRRSAASNTPSSASGTPPSTWACWPNTTMTRAVRMQARRCGTTSLSVPA